MGGSGTRVVRGNKPQSDLADRSGATRLVAIRRATDFQAVRCVVLNLENRGSEELLLESLEGCLRVLGAHRTPGVRVAHADDVLGAVDDNHEFLAIFATLAESLRLEDDLADLRQQRSSLLGCANLPHATRPRHISIADRELCGVFDANQSGVRVGRDIEVRTAGRLDLRLKP